MAAGKSSTGRKGEIKVAHPRVAHNLTGGCAQGGSNDQVPTQLPREGVSRRKAAPCGGSSAVNAPSKIPRSACWSTSRTLAAAKAPTPCSRGAAHRGTEGAGDAIRAPPTDLAGEGQVAEEDGDVAGPAGGREREGVEEHDRDVAVRERPREDLRVRRGERVEAQRVAVVVVARVGDDRRQLPRLQNEGKRGEKRVPIVLPHVDWVTSSSRR